MSVMGSWIVCTEKRMEMSRRVLKYVICTISEMFHHPFGIFPAAETMRNDTMPERTGEK